jgi:succinyl-CoA synthetase alpha subunit
MGHAGAVISGSSGTAEAKIAALREAGVVVCESLAGIGQTMHHVLARRKVRSAPRRAANAARTPRKRAGDRNVRTMTRRAARAEGGPPKL